MLRLLLAVFTASLAASPLNAWTIKFLTPATPFSPGVSSFGTFRDYLTATGATVTSGSLATHTIGSADAVIVDIVNYGVTYTAAELSVLTALRNSNVPVLVIGELVVGTAASWASSNAQLAGIIGGGATADASANGANTQTVNSATRPILTQGVTSVTFAAPGRFSAIGTGNIAITSGNTIVLAGNNKNFLVALDTNWLQNGTIGSNTQFAQNVATFLSNPTTLPTVGSFSVSAAPATPTAAIDADPTVGNGTLDTTVTWTTSNAATVSLSGPGFDPSAPAAASGSQPVTVSVIGEHTFRVTASPAPATLSWTSTGATTLTLIPPTGGTGIDVTGQTGYAAATTAGTWTLRATNANGNATRTVTVDIPAPAIALAGVEVLPLPTIPPVIDDGTVTVIPDPDVPGSIVIGGGIVPPDPDDPDQSQVFGTEQIFLVTTTDLENGPWTPAARSTYTVEVSPEGDILAVVTAPHADQARFWRLATTLHPVDVNGAPDPDAPVLYSCVPFGQYKVTVPAGQQKLVAYQLDTTGTGSIALSELIPAAPASTTATRWTAGVQAKTTYIRTGWAQDFNVALGEAVLVYNPSASPITLTVTGTVPLTASRTLANGLSAAGSALPVAGPITDFGITPVASDQLTEVTTGTLIRHSYIRTGWAGGIPAFQIGEGFLYNRVGAPDTWTQEITLTTDTPDLTIRK